MCVMLFFTAFGHFRFSKGMASMIPKFIPFKNRVVLVTGLMEILFGLGLLFNQLRTVSGWSLIIFFLLLLPANIHAAMQKLDYQKGTYDGKGIQYLWFRIPMQLFLIWWVWYFSLNI